MQSVYAKAGIVCRNQNRSRFRGGPQRLAQKGVQTCGLYKRIRGEGISRFLRRGVFLRAGRIAFNGLLFRENLDFPSGDG